MKKKEKEEIISSEGERGIWENIIFPLKALWFRWLFRPKEVKATLKILDEIHNEILNETDSLFFGAANQLVKDHIREMILVRPDIFADVIKKVADPREWIYNAIANTAGDLVESGQYHLYRGVLNPVGPGKGLLKIFNAAIDALVQMGAIDLKKADEQKEAIGKNIMDVG